MFALQRTEAATFTDFFNYMEHVEQITHDREPLAYIIRAGMQPAETTFLTPPEFKQQVGFIVYPAGGAIQRHDHRPLERHLVGTLGSLDRPSGGSVKSTFTMTIVNSSRRAYCGPAILC